MLAPARPAELVTSEDGGDTEVCVCSDDWKSMPGDQLLLRLGALDGSDEY